MVIAKQTVTYTRADKVYRDNAVNFNDKTTFTAIIVDILHTK